MPRLARWLDGWSDNAENRLRRALVERAMQDIGIEEGPTANRSPYLDTVLRNARTAVGQPWCAAILRQWCDDAGVAFPPSGSASVDVWIAWARANKTWRSAESGYAPIPGDIVVYGKRNPEDGDHIGVVARVAVRGARAVEGNTSFAGFGREGIAVDYKPVTTSRVLGYITPTPKA